LVPFMVPSTIGFHAVACMLFQALNPCRNRLPPGYGMRGPLH
jgi:hypothetical protein